MPVSVMHLLQDAGSVQAMSGHGHHVRKAMFLGMMLPEGIERVRRAFDDEWRAGVARWSRVPEVRLHDELVEVLMRTACRWVGIPVDDDEVRRVGADVADMVERAASIGPVNWTARARRLRAERWARDVVRRARDGRLPVAAGSPLQDLVTHVDADGSPLAVEVAGVELLNLIRPTVAVARFIDFALHALHTHPRWARGFAAGDESDLRGFVQEVRRFYPFFPVIAGTVAQPFDGLGGSFAPGYWVMLDLFGTNRDPRLWHDPEAFDPTRFRDWDGDPNTLIPQGGGDAAGGHRCPGEDITIALVEEAVRLTTRETDMTLPPQDLRISLRRFPALPRRTRLRGLRADAVSRG
jgi:fatty-acid peroxygenase